MNNSICALIMAGGKGTRFWPLSTEEKPKQFLNLIGDKTMIQMTVNRIRSVIPIERIFICTGKRYVNLVKEQLPELPEKNIIIETEGRNTAPCITLSTLIIKRYFKECNIVVLPSDHLIENENKFREIIIESDNYLAKNHNAIVTLGITPNRPETGYGYIKCSNEVNMINNIKVIKVEKFVEKPNKEKAERYLNKGSYLWNSGIFIWNVNNILEKIKKYSPNTYEELHLIEKVKEDKIQQLIDSNYKNTEAISIDYAVLEKSDNVYVIPSNFGWDDVGSWNALERYRKKDINNNILIGKCKALNSNNNIIINSNSQELVIKDINNSYVISNDNLIIFGKKSDMDSIKGLKKELKTIND